MFEDEKRKLAETAAQFTKYLGEALTKLDEHAKDVAFNAARVLKAESDPTRSVSDAVMSLLESVAEIDAITEEVGLQTGLSIRTIVEHGAGIGKAAEVKVAQAQESDCHSKQNASVRKQVWDMTGGKCAYCDTALAPDGNGSLSFVVEHVVPTSQGGPDNLANYVPACMSCNTSKGADHVLLFIQRRFPNRARPAQPYVPERME